MNLADPILESVEAVADRVALVAGEREVTYADIGRAIGRAAGALSARGVGAGDRVALADAAGLVAVATVLGAARIGAAVAPMSPSLTAGEMQALASAAGCGDVGVASAEAAGRLEEALGAAPLGENDLIATAAGACVSLVGEEDVAVVLFTSGTTGVPKPIPLTHGILAARVRAFAPPADPAVAPAVAIVCVPFHHVAGLVGMLVGLAGGSTSVVQRRFDAGEWLRLVSRHRVQRAFLVPAMLHRILDHPDFTRADLSSLQMITYGAAPAAAGLVARAVEAIPHAGFINVFGQTETLGAVTALGPEDHRAGRAGSVGRPMSGVDVRIVDPATGDDVRDGEVGEFWVRAPHTASPGWVRSGDLVRRDADGYLYAAGRLSDVINRGGEKIDPAEVEDVLRSHPSSADAAVFGVADAEMGERVAAALVARENVDLDGLRAWCRERLAPYKVPERVVFVDAVPLTELGKVSRKDLRALLDG